MEVHLEDVARPELGGTTVRTHGGARADSLLGAVCHEHGKPYDPSLTLYTRGNKPLLLDSTLKSQGVRSGDTLYVRPRQHSDLLYRAPWGRLAVAAALLALVLLLFTALAGSPLGPRAPFSFGLVVDAGSSHSEMTLYRWAQPKLRGTGRVEQEAHRSLENGLTVLDPRTAGSTLALAMGPLLAKASGDTPVYMGATAGMRLLNISDPERADALLLGVECALRKHGLRRASIITGSEEGLFAWLSVNYLLEALSVSPDDTPDTLGALDLGGASTQVAFEGNSPNATHLKLYGRQYSVVSRSYLCFGVNEALRRFLSELVMQQNYSAVVKSPCHYQGYAFSRTAEDLFGSPCTQTPENARWLQEHDGNTTFTFAGEGTGEACYAAVTELLNPDQCYRTYKECLEPMRPAVPTHKKFVAFSAYYYTASAINATNTTLDGFKRSTSALCSRTWEDALTTGIQRRYLPNFCFQGMFLRDILLNKYGFSDDTWGNVAFLKEARGFSVGWSLGYMINATNAIPESAPPSPLLSGAGLGILVFLCIALFIFAAIAVVLARRRARAERLPAS